MEIEIYCNIESYNVGEIINMCGALTRIAHCSILHLLSHQGISKLVKCKITITIKHVTHVIVYEVSLKYNMLLKFVYLMDIL